MTEYYNTKELNSRHLVKFVKPEKTDYEYYDFDEKEWRPVKLVNKLPYNLAYFRFTDKIDPDEEKCVVTSMDSYRLNGHDLHEYFLYYNHEDMLKEKEWREEIVRKGKEMDFYKDKKSGERVKVCWTKSDIIPGIILIGPRKYPNINIFGYFYKESSKLFKSGTLLKPISEEKLKQEKFLKEKNEKKFEILEKEIEIMKKNLPILHTTFGDIYDTVKYWKTLKKYPFPITIKDVNDWENKNCQTRSDILSSTKPGDIKLIFYGLSSVAKDYDCCFIDFEKEISYEYEKPRITLSKCNFVFDINVYNATYAYMEITNFSEDNNSNRKFEMQHQLSTNTFTFPEINYENPLFVSVSGSKICIYTDGNIIKYKGGMYQNKELFKITNLKNTHTVNKLKNELLFIGHLWNYSFAIPI